MTTKNTTRGKRTTGRLIGLALEIPPVAYVLLTGQAPMWVRVWIGAWLSMWLLATVVRAQKAETSQGRA